MKTHLSHRLPAKIVAFCLAVITLCMAGASVLGIFLMLDLNVYTRTSEDVKITTMRNVMYDTCHTILSDVARGSVRDAEYIAARTNGFYQAVNASTGQVLWSNTDDFDSVASATNLRFAYFSYYDEDGTYYHYADRFYDGIDEEFFVNHENVENAYILNVAVNTSFATTDKLSFTNDLVNALYALSYPIYAILAASLILFIALLCFLLYGAGRRTGHEEVCKSWFTEIPFDLLTAAIFGLSCVSVVAVSDFFYYSYLAAWVLSGAVVIIWACIALGYLYTAAVRVKLRTIFKNTVIWRCCRILKRIWLFIWRGIKEIWRGFKDLAGGLPLIWKFVLGMLVMIIVEFIFHVACMWDGEVLLFFWFVEWAIQGTAAMALALMLRRLQKGGQALAAGDLSYQVDTKRMLWDFKKHGEDLNNIALGLNRAVEERLKSERLKTELITNVSHDIKTPLTSIINYSDLICKENCDNEKIREYSAVLLRQSERLKKLIEDLVDASKASTGNVEVNLAPFELDVLLTQAVGEYEQKLADCRLDLIVKRPEKGARIMADGRHMWRIFDNLMNNICKYALPGTRVYLTVEDKFGQAVISFKNTSRYELDVSSDELMERFVRGDSSRSTEGSGLGLSIARSLTDLQGGKLELTVDGDLFKAVLTFKQI